MNFCPNCGQKVPPDTKFCPNCGYGLQETGPSPETHQTTCKQEQPRPSTQINSALNQERVKTAQTKTISWYRHASQQTKMIGIAVIIIVILLLGLHIYHDMASQQLIRQSPWYIFFGSPSDELSTAIADTNSDASKMTFRQNGKLTDVDDDSSSSESGTWQVQGKLLIIKEDSATVRGRLSAVNGTASGYQYTGYKLTNIKITGMDASQTAGIKFYIVREK